MRLGGRLAASIEILDTMEASPRPSSVALQDWARTHRFAGSSDRSAIGSIVHDALRNRLSNSWRLGGDTMRLAAFGALLFQWGMSLEAIDAALDGDPHAPAPLSPDERHALENRSLGDAPDHVRVNVPEPLLVRLKSAFGIEWESELAAFAGRPSLDLRANVLKGGRDKVIGALARAGAVPAPYLASAIRIAPGAGEARLPNVTAEPAFARGLFEVQDLGSQLAAALVAPEPKSQVLDYCAGAGGKTLAVAAALGNAGQVHAYDVDRRRLSPLVERMKRAGARNIQLCEDAARLKPLEGRMDRVIADAPCTGTGTWRRRPDIKWRLSETNLAQRIADQDAVLDDAARYVRPGGRLIYITCSILPDENADRVAAFLARNRAFTALDPAGVWQAATGGALDGHARRAGDGLLLTPATTGTDGFFAAILERQA